MLNEYSQRKWFRLTGIVANIANVGTVFVAHAEPDFTPSLDVNYVFPHYVNLLSSDFYGNEFYRLNVHESRLQFVQKQGIDMVINLCVELLGEETSGLRTLIIDPVNIRRLTQAC